MTKQDWLDMALEFERLAETCDTPMRAERRNDDGTVDVIEDVNRSSVALCLRLAAEADS